jgi:hypothetical protein
MNKEVFKVTKDGKDLELAVKEPTAEDGNKARAVKRRTFAQAVTEGAILRINLDRHIKEQGLWNEDKELRRKKLDEQITEKTLQLKKGGMKLSDAKQVAIDLRALREERRVLLTEINSLDINTAEGQAENAHFNSLVASCLVYNDSGKVYYKDLDDYLKNSASEEAFKGASLLAKMIYALDDDFEKNLPENKFLRQYQFVDDNLNFINKDKKLVDSEGRLINEDGRYVNESGELVDKFGNRVDENGEFVVESQPFLDDDGNPIEIPS